MTAKIVRYPDPDRKSRNADSVDRDLADSAIIIVLPIIRVERYAEPGMSLADQEAWQRRLAKPRIRRKAWRRET